MIICNPSCEAYTYRIYTHSFLYHLSSPEEGYLLTESARDVTFYSSHLHKPNPWCLRMANPEPLPQRATWKSRRLRGQEPMLESWPARESGWDSGAPLRGQFHPLTTSFLAPEGKLKLKKGCSLGGVTYDHLLPLH